MHANRIQEIAKEHVAIRETMSRIEQELDRIAKQPTPQTEHWELPDLVRSFRTHLRRHFQLEEEGGLLGAAVQYYDARSRRVVEELVAEHREFERTIDRIAAELSGVVLNDEAPAPVVQDCYDGDIRRLLTGLSTHEQLENELLESIIQTNSESGD